ncbi:MAG: endolytic transglycosylase MltG [Synergistaceae bacterium]|nr:endolytic transglycosylase MltG [Synergistaceae bacterium]
MKKRLLILLLTLFLLGVGVGTTAFFMKYPHEFWDQILPLPQAEMAVVVLRPGINARQCALAFYEQGALTQSPVLLARWMARLGIDRKIRPGQYRVYRAGAWDLARQLLEVQPISSSLTIVPGMDVFSLRELFGEGSSPNFLNVSTDILREALLDDAHYPEPMRDLLITREELRMAFLLPETYFVVEESPEELIRIASREWWSRFGERVVSMTSKDLGRIATVASIIQREALRDEERAVIAGVVENRLKKDMLLQIDATVIYSWKLKGKKLTRVFNKDLAVDSPYNTYVSPGLPPTPICIPSTESWEAALAPERNLYYYYVARKNGYHYFAQTYEEHRRNIKKARTE